jgi:hypothetical protein
MMQKKAHELAMQATIEYTQIREKTKKPLRVQSLQSYCHSLVYQYAMSLKNDNISTKAETVSSQCTTSEH